MIMRCYEPGLASHQGHGVNTDIGALGIGSRVDRVAALLLLLSLLLGYASMYIDLELDALMARVQLSSVISLLL